MPAPTKEATLLTSIQTISIVVGALVVLADSWSAARPQGLCCPQRLEPLSLPAPPRRCAAALGSPISLFRNLGCALFPSPWRGNSAQKGFTLLMCPGRRPDLQCPGHHARVP